MLLARFQSYDESALLQRLSAGDAASFEQLFAKNWDAIFSVALVMTKSVEMADDITQDVFLMLWKDRQRAAEIQNLRAFLNNTVKFLVYKKLRRLRVEDAYRLYLTNRICLEPTDAEQETALTLKQLESSVHAGIRQLPPQQQTAFLMSREHGYSHDEISAKMGISKKTVKDYIVKAIAFLRLHLKGNIRIINL